MHCAAESLQEEAPSGGNSHNIRALALEKRRGRLLWRRPTTVPEDSRQCSKKGPRHLPSYQPTAPGKTKKNDLEKKIISTQSQTEMKSEQLSPCVNPGNPVFSCMLDPKTLCTATSLSKPQMIMYKTKSSDYGEFLPIPQFLPCNYTPKGQVFSSHIRASGFYQNNTLNTALDKNRTVDFPNFQHTL
ncbi:LOW QUALITY PROTEIN: piercer of microtubule wall 2 protein [Rhynchocyon petersi]